MPLSWLDRHGSPHSSTCSLSRGYMPTLFTPPAFPWGIVRENDSPSSPIISHICKSPRGSMTMDSTPTTLPWVTWKIGPTRVVLPPDPSSPMDLGMLGPQILRQWRGQCLRSSEAHVAFAYLPHAPSAHPRSWAIASEIAVEAKRLAYNLNQIVNGISIEEEFEDIPSDVAGPSGTIN